MSTMTKSNGRGNLASGTAGDAKAFRQQATVIAKTLLEDWVGPDRAGEATGRIAAALSSAAASAKKPGDFYECTPTSIANCVAIAALTGIMPGVGGAALAYLVPRSPRRGEQKQLGFMFSHRGLNALAGRSGQIMVAIPISVTDEISVNADGEVEVGDIDFDNPPTEFEELRGVVVVVKRTDSGAVITRGWMPKKLIEKRRNGSDSYSYAIKPGNEWARDSDPWHKWPVEMAMKTAMHYAVSRGWCVIDDASSVRALSYDAAIDVAPVKKPAAIEGPRSLDQLADNLSQPNGAVSHVGPEDDEPETVDGEIMEPESTADILNGVSADIQKIKSQKGVLQFQQDFEANHQLDEGQKNQLDYWCQNRIEALKS